ncbi:MAG: hypothetical protein ACOCZW_04320, partial [Bacteroidota bacterium]
MAFYTNSEGAPKYDFIIRPGGDINDIKLRYKGQNEIRASESSITVETEFGPLQEEIPIAYYTNESGRRVRVDVRPVIDGNELRFEAGEVPEGRIFVIDPYLIWGTYYGGSSQEEIIQVKNYDPDEHDSEIIAVGWTSGSNNLASVGAYQGSHSGDTDAFLASFSHDLSDRNWSTYFGGSEGDQGTGIDINGSDIAITGVTNSHGLATSGMHKTNKGFHTDLFISIFTSSGVHQRTTYFGGDGEDFSTHNNIAFLNSGSDIVITGQTHSSSGLATAGSHQPAFGLGNNDAFVAKINSSLNNLDWATYFGGNGDECACAVTVEDNIIYFTGKSTTEQSLGFNLNSYMYRGILGVDGDQQAYIAKFSQNGTLLAGTFYDTGGDEEGKDLYVTNSGDIILVGSTRMIPGNPYDIDTLVTSNGYQQYNAGLDDGFIAIFDNDLEELKYGTLYGGSSDDEINALSVEEDAVFPSIYVCGETKSGNGAM